MAIDDIIHQLCYPSTSHQDIILTQAIQILIELVETWQLLTIALINPYVHVFADILQYVCNRGFPMGSVMIPAIRKVVRV